jgi:hypothetical protein
MWRFLRTARVFAQQLGIYIQNEVGAEEILPARFSSCSTIWALELLSSKAQFPNKKEGTA